MTEPLTLVLPLSGVVRTPHSDLCRLCGSKVHWQYNPPEGWRCLRCDVRGLDDPAYALWRSQQLREEPREEAVAQMLPPTAPSVPVDTSEMAADEIEDHRGRLAKQVLGYIRRHADTGVSSDAIEEALGLRHQTCSARIRELVLAGLVQDTGIRVENRSKRRAIAWVPVELKSPPVPIP